jgi:hypothetical protein
MLSTKSRHVLALGVAEVLGDRQPGQPDAQPRAGRLRHLAVDQGRLRLGGVARRDDAGLAHLAVEVVALARALPHAGEDRVAAVVHGDVVDQLHDDDRLAHAGPAEEAHLASLGVRLEEIDDLDPRLEHLDCRGLVLVAGRLAVNRPALLRVDRPSSVHRLSDDVQDPAERLLADRHRDPDAQVHRLHAADHSVGRLHRDAPDAVLAEVLCDLGNDVDRDAGRLAVILDLDRVVDRRELALGEFHVDDGADDLDDAANVQFCHICSLPSDEASKSLRV